MSLSWSRKGLTRHQVQVLPLINFPPFRNPHYDHDQLRIVNLVKNPVFTLSQAVFVLIREFFTSSWAGVFRKALDAIDDPLPVLLRDRFQFLHSRGLDEELIECHAF